MKKAIAEFIGTFALVLIGCGTIVVGGMAAGATAINELAIALAFGLSIVAMAYGIGQISGCHVNPAVSFGVFAAGRMTVKELLTYWVAQVAGAVVAAFVLYLILSGKASGWNVAVVTLAGVASAPVTLGRTPRRTRPTRSSLNSWPRVACHSCPVRQEGPLTSTGGSLQVPVSGIA